MQLTRLYFAFCSIILFSVSALAQSKARITITREADGKTTIETREIELSDGEEIDSILRELGVMNEMGELKSGQRFEIQMEKSTETTPQGSNRITIEPQAIPFSSLQPATERQAWLGITMRDALVPGKEEKAVRITEIDPGSPAEGAQLEDGDLITHIAGARTESAEDVALRIHSQKPGDQIKITLIRNGKNKTVKVTLGERLVERNFRFERMNPETLGEMPFIMEFNPDSIMMFPKNKEMIIIDSCMKLAQPFNWSGEGLNHCETAFLGVTPASEATESGVTVGSVVPGSCAESMGLEAGDVILSIGGKLVNSFDELAEFVSSRKPGEEIEIIASRNGREKVLQGTLGSRPASSRDDFRIFHDFKGMDDEGQWLYDYEFDMDMDDLRKELDSLGISFDLGNGGVFPMPPVPPVSPVPPVPPIPPVSGARNRISLSIEIMDITADDLNRVNQSASPRLENKNDFIPDRITFFPNPGEGVLQLQFSTQDKGDMRVLLFNSRGGLVYEEKVQDFTGEYSRQIDFSEHANGTYFLQVSVGNKSFSRKLIKGE
jgi:membrane-associated protease RseP (regulator of RpoE activity)